VTVVVRTRWAALLRSTLASQARMLFLCVGGVLTAASQVSWARSSAAASSASSFLARRCTKRP